MPLITLPIAPLTLPVIVSPVIKEPDPDTVNVGGFGVVPIAADS